MILEFKRKKEKLDEDRDQAADYAKDIKALHRESDDKRVTPFLVLTYTQCAPYKDGIVNVTSRGNIVKTINGIIEEKLTPTNVDKWIDSDWDEKPDIIEAAKTGFALAKIPSIKRANSLGLTAAKDYLAEKVTWAKHNKKYVIAVVSGVPGAGKTYLGINFAIDSNETDRSTKASYMSGNNALIYVLEDALEHASYIDPNTNEEKVGIRASIQNVHDYIDGTLDEDSPNVNYNIIVFDEGQRAWNLEQMKSRHHVDNSETELMIRAYLKTKNCTKANERV